MELKELEGNNILILGVGNEVKGDDSLGKYIIDNITYKNKLFCGEMPENYISKIKEMNFDIILIIDAIDFGKNPGDAVFTEAKNVESQSLSTHSMPLSLFCKFFPNNKIYLLGIQPKSLEFGKPLSKEVKVSADSLISKLNTLFIS